MDNDLRTWLGPAYDDMTDLQRDQITAAAADIDARYPAEDFAEIREAALTAAVQFLLGDITPEQAAHQLANTRRAQALALAAAVQIGVMLVTLADKPNKSDAARRVGVDRMTLLDALGQR